MELIQRMIRYFAVVRRQLRRHRRAVVVAACAVVFATTYALTLPAVTLDEQTANDQPGIELGQATADTQDGTAEAVNDDDAQQATDTAATATGDEAATDDAQQATETTGDTATTDDAKATDTDTAADKAESQYQAAELHATDDGNKYDVTVSYGEDAKLAAGTTLFVKELSGDEYEAAKAKVVEAKQAAGEDTEGLGVAAIDVTILDKDGNEVEPAEGAKVDVTIKAKDALPDDVDSTSVEVQHLDERTDTVDTVADAANPAADAKVDVSDKDATADFSVDSFSTYAVTWSTADGDAVDLSDLDGKTVIVMRSANGWNSVMLSTLRSGYENLLASALVTMGQGPVENADGTTSSKTLITVPDGTSADSLYWRFTKVEGSDNQFYVEAVNQDGTSKSPRAYLSISSSGLGTSSTRQAITVGTSTAHPHEVRLYDGNYSVNLNGGTNSGGEWGYGTYTRGDDDENNWVALYATDSTQVKFPDLTTVETVNSTSAGITMRMIDYDDNTQGSYNIGGSYKSDADATQGLLNRRLGDDGYPATTGGTSLYGLFSGGTAANHLFLKSTYDSSGYYEYSSFQNYAYLNNDGDFTVYGQIGTPSDEDFLFYQRGNFMPYNRIVAGGYSSNTNQYDENGNALSDGAARKGEVLYKTQGTNDYHFGMYLEASFYQPAGGQVDGDDMVYEFNGDDDLWVYIDNVLVLDIGGIHDARSGSIDFKSGVVTVRTGSGAVTTTIKDQFKAAGVFPDGTTWNDNKVDSYFSGDTFRDYTGHTMKMFYMERGAGASNLHMRFNLPVIPAGSFDVTKRLSNTDKDRYANVQFAYQAFKKESDGTYSPLTSATYAGTDTNVVFSDDVTFEDGGASYDNVFYLKPGETARFSGLNVNDDYYVREIGVKSDEYDSVKINSSNITEETGTGTGGTYKSYRTTDATPAERPMVTFTNDVSAQNSRELHIKKQMQEGSDAGGTTFSFKVQLEGTNGTLQDYSGDYYLVDGDGDYYTRGDDGTLTSNGKTATVCGTVTDGTITGVPAGYEVVITQILSGTDFKVEEANVPAGYEQVGEPSVTEDRTYQSDQATISGAQGSIKLNYDSQVVVTNKAQTITVKKVGADGTTALTDATFRLMKGSENATATSGVDDSGMLTEAEDTNGNGTGTYVVSGLPDGTYTLTEVSAPSGYVVLADALEFTLSAGKVTLAEGTDTSIFSVSDTTITVKNTPGKALPDTGGRGTALLTASGAALITLALLGLALRREAERGDA